MSDNINKMDFKQLRNEVQTLRDELAIMKRKYEDILYNLDTDNFSQRVVKQGKDMYTKIEQTAGEISLQAEKVGENTKNLAELSITAKEIQSAVFEENEDGTKTSRITQTAEKIESAVEEINTSVEDVETRLFTEIEQTKDQINLTVEEYVTNALADGDYVTNTTLESRLELTASGIYAEVSEIYETQESATDAYGALEQSISKVEVTADGISSEVSEIKGGKIGNYTLFTQDSQKFTFYGDYMDISSAIRLTDNEGNLAFSIFHDQSGNGSKEGVVYMWGMGNYSYRPVVIGSESAQASQGVYLHSIEDSNLIATQGWVLDNVSTGGTAIAVFA